MAARGLVWDRALARWWQFSFSEKTSGGLIGTLTSPALWQPYIRWTKSSPAEHNTTTVSRRRNCLSNCSVINWTESWSCRYVRNESSFMALAVPSSDQMNAGFDWKAGRLAQTGRYLSTTGCSGNKGSKFSYNIIILYLFRVSNWFSAYDPIYTEKT